MNPYQQQSPHGRPGETNPYRQPVQPPWDAPTLPAGTPPAPGGGGRKTAVIAVATATAVVVAAGVTGYLVLGGDKDDAAVGPGPTASASSPAAEPTPAESGGRGSGSEPKPVVPGWKVVVNDQRGIAFDVPPDWDRKAADWVSYVAEKNDPEDTPIVAYVGPAVLKEQWCQSDDDKDGDKEDTPLAAAGSRGENGAKSTEEAARRNAELWIYGAYTQPDKSKVKAGTAEPYTTKSGILGTVATAESSGVVKKGPCDHDGKATVFGFKDAKGDFVSWTFHGVKGVPEEVPDVTVRKVLSTVRLTGVGAEKS